jgi:SsrA-binding protein
MTKPIAENRRARYDYFIEETFEAGIMLTGTEVKSLRVGRANIAESYASVEGRTIKLINADIPPYGHANRFNHEPRRHRTLLLHKKQIETLIGAVQRDGRTLIPLKLYWNEKGLGQARDRPGQGQEESRQARDRSRARLGSRQGSPDEGRPQRLRLPEDRQPQRQAQCVARRGEPKNRPDVLRDGPGGLSATDPPPHMFAEKGQGVRRQGPDPRLPREGGTQIFEDDLLAVPLQRLDQFAPQSV